MGFIPSKKVHNQYGDFDSEPEWLCFEQKILPLWNSGEIYDVELQHTFEIIPRLTKKVIVPLKTKFKYVERVVEKAAVYTCDFLYKRNTSAGIECHIVEFKSNYSAKARDYSLRRKLIRRKIAEWNEAEGWEKWVFDEYKEKDLVMPPKKKREKKPKKEKVIKKKKSVKLK